MTSWADVAAAEPQLAEQVRRTFAARRHATLCTLRRDGAPRISGTEVEFTDDGELVLGMMPASRKALDLRRDPRVAVHCPTVDPPEDDPSAWLGDGKVSGRAVELSDPTRTDEPHRFRVDVAEVVLTRVGTPADHLVLQWWRPGEGLRTQRRA